MCGAERYLALLGCRFGPFGSEPDFNCCVSCEMTMVKEESLFWDRRCYSQVIETHKSIEKLPSVIITWVQTYGTKNIKALQGIDDPFLPERWVGANIRSNRGNGSR